MMPPTNDPKPWIELETGLRLTQEEVDEGNKNSHCWYGLAYEPREEKSK